jgi:xylose dehydrogenase (NAD/NADP)
MVRWGILSTANINRRLIPAIRSSRRGELVAIASRDEARANAYAAQWDIPNSFGSYSSMLESGIIDAVYISLPNHLHAEWTVKSLEAGVHVLCEKPFALTLDEVDHMIVASRAAGLVLSEAFMYRHHPQTKRIGDWVKQGRLGEISLVRGIFNFRLQNREDIRLDPEMGGGSLWDIGVYPLSMAQYVMGGPPEWVVGDQWIGETGVDETFTGQLHYSHDRFAQISSSFRTPFYTFIEIIGTEGTLNIHRPFIQIDDERQPVFQPATGEAQALPVPEKELYLGEIEDMNAAILDGKPPYISLDETRNHVRTALALYESARKREVVELSGNGLQNINTNGIISP